MIHNIISSAKNRWWIAFPLAFVVWLIYVWWNCDHWPNNNCTAFEGKTVWEVLELLIIPVTLAIVAAYLDKLERKADRENAKDYQREVALQNYFDAIERLVFDKNLQADNSDYKVRMIAQAKTISTLQVLDNARKSVLIKFLCELDLVNASIEANPIIKLSRINLKGVELDVVNLEGADLQWTNLEGARLQHAHLERAHLEFAHFEGANLNGAKLKRAYLRYKEFSFLNLNFSNAIMPDGKRFDSSLHTVEMLTSKNND
jgi:hypothetical protein